MALEPRRPASSCHAPQGVDYFTKAAGDSKRRKSNAFRRAADDDAVLRARLDAVLHPRRNLMETAASREKERTIVGGVMLILPHRAFSYRCARGAGAFRSGGAGVADGHHISGYHRSSDIVPGR
jgi:hypothetical protein